MMNDSEDDLLGFPSDVVYAVGRLALAAAQLESAVRFVYTQCTGKEPGTLPASNVATLLRETEPRPVELPVPNGPPIVLRGDVVSSDERTAWCDGVTAAVKGRGRVIHSAPMFTEQEGHWVPALREIRPGNVTIVELDAVDKLTHEVVRLAATGFDFLTRITASVSPEDQQRLWSTE